MRPPRAIAVVPTLLTLGNGACGFGAISFAAKIGPEHTAENSLFVAALLIFLGMLFDMLDGSAARLTKQTSDIGAQLDSLCDAVSFGVAPAFLMLQFLRHDATIGGEFPLFVQYPSRLLWTIAVLFVLCALLRLARFNVETEEEDTHATFSGLPSPAAAGAIASFPIAMPAVLDIAEAAQSGFGAYYLVPTVKLILPVVTLLVACLMVSRLPYPHVFNQIFRGQKTRRHIIQIVFAFAVIYWVHELALPILFCYFAFASPVRYVSEELLRARRIGRPAAGPLSRRHSETS